MRSQISYFHKLNSLFYSISVLKMIALLLTTLIELITHSVTSGHGTSREQSDVPLGLAFQP